MGAVAAAEGVLAQTVDYVNERKAFGAPIAQLQTTRFKIAEMATDIRVNRAFVDARVQRIYGGASEIMKELISRSVLGK